MSSRCFGETRPLVGVRHENNNNNDNDNDNNFLAYYCVEPYFCCLFLENVHRYHRYILFEAMQQIELACSCVKIITVSSFL